MHTKYVILSLTVCDLYFRLSRQAIDLHIQGHRVHLQGKTLLLGNNSLQNSLAVDQPIRASLSMVQPIKV